MKPCPGFGRKKEKLHRPKLPTALFGSVRKKVRLGQSPQLIFPYELLSERMSSYPKARQLHANQAHGTTCLTKAATTGSARVSVIWV